MNLEIAIPQFGRQDHLFVLLEQLDHAITELPNPDQVVVRVMNDEPDAEADIKAKLAETRNPSRFRLTTNPSRLGLSENLVAALTAGESDYVWIMGNDDKLSDTGIVEKVMCELNLSGPDLVVLGKQRVDENGQPMFLKSDCELETSESTFWEFCKSYGWLSSLGFISTVVMKRSEILEQIAKETVDTLYPLLFGITAAHSTSKVLARGDLKILQRTLSPATKLEEAQPGAREANFFGPERDKLYFGIEFMGGLDLLSRNQSLDYDSLPQVIEPIFGDGLIDLIIKNCEIAARSGIGLPDFRSISWLRVVRLAPASQKRLERLLEEARTKIIQTKKLSFSVVTPCKGTEFLDQCVQSVQDQDLSLISEHIVMDAGDFSETKKILANKPTITHVKSDDSGQSEALNNGFRKATGDILCWLNADDYFQHESVFEEVEAIFRANPGTDVLFGQAEYVGSDSKFLRKTFVHGSEQELVSSFLRGCGIAQPSTFFRRDVFERFGPLLEGLHYSMDYEFWIRLAFRGVEFRRSKSVWSAMRHHPDAKTVRDRKESYLEVLDVMRMHYGWVPWFWVSQLAEHSVRGTDGIITMPELMTKIEAEEVSRLSAALNLKLNGSNYRAMRRADFLATRSDWLERRTTPFSDIWIALSSWVTTPVSFRSRLASAATSKPSSRLPRGVAREVESQISLVEANLHGSLGKNSRGAECGSAARRGPGYQSQEINGLLLSIPANERRAMKRDFHEMVASERVRNSERICVIAGNGPSLNLINWEQLDWSQSDIIASNNAFLKPELTSRARYFTIVNRHVAEQSDFEVAQLEGPTKIFPWWLSHALPPNGRNYYCEAVGKAEFSLDIVKNISWRHTVSFFNMQLAAGLGFKRIVLIGMDHHYVQSHTAREGDMTHQQSADLNHFSTRYFQNKSWQAASTEKMEEMYVLARSAFETLDIECVNSTEGGRLEVFPRVPLERALGM